MSKGSQDRWNSRTRRGVLAGLLAGGTTAAVLSPLSDVLERLAPPSGELWQNRARVLEHVPATVENPYGSATVTYDEYHVPHVEADTEPAAYFLVGYAQAADRLFQMDVMRRFGSGTISEVFGDVFLEHDLLMTKLDVEGAIEASLDVTAGSDAARMVEAYADGVTAYIDQGPHGVLFGLFDYEPEPWTAFDTGAVGMAMYHLQTFGFGALYEDVKRGAFDDEEYRRLFPDHFDHDAPVLRDDAHVGSVAPSSEPNGGAVDRAFVDRLGRLDEPTKVGSNAWTVSGEHTESGDPLLCSDPHLQLGAPPVLYRQHVSAGDVDVRGAAVPGVPFFFVGETDHGAWGYTTAMADTIDFYTYETAGGEYRYGDEWHALETDRRTVRVRDPVDGEVDSREVEVKKTVHGPYIEEEVGGESHHVGIAWTPLTGNRAMEAMHGWTTAETVTEFREATRQWDAIPGNLHFAAHDGGTCYQLGGRVPIRRVDGEVVRGDRVFDGSAGEAEWEGFTPYGQSSWEEFIPFEELPAAVDADYVASANQRVTDDPPYPLGRETFSGYRAQRLVDRLEAAIADGEPIDREFVRSLQLDTVDPSAPELVPAILDARDRFSGDAEPWVEELADWDYRMDRDSAAALVYHRFLEHFQEVTWKDTFEERGLGRRYWPTLRVLVSLPADSPYFDGDRGAVVSEAIDRAVEEIDDHGWETYGEFNRPEFDHELGEFVSGLNYPRYPTDGSGNTLRMNTGPGNPWGAVFRMISDDGGDSLAVLAGGNAGSPYSEHYHDQLRLWADGEYTPLGERPSEGPDITATGDET